MPIFRKLAIGVKVAGVIRFLDERGLLLLKFGRSGCIVHDGRTTISATNRDMSFVDQDVSNISMINI